MTGRHARLRKLEAQRVGGGLEVWRESEDAPGVFTLAHQADGRGGVGLTRAAILARPDRRGVRVFVTYGEAGLLHYP